MHQDAVSPCQLPPVCPLPFPPRLLSPPEALCVELEEPLWVLLVPVEFRVEFVLEFMFWYSSRAV